MNVNIVNNYYKIGPTKNNHPERIAGIGIRTSEYTEHDSDQPNGWDVMWHKWGTFYVTGNVNPDYSTVTNDNWTYGIYNEIDNDKNDGMFTEDAKRDMRLDTPIEFLYTTTHSAEDAFDRVLAYAGASLHRDAYDKVMVDDAKNGTAKYGDSGILDSQDEVVYDDNTTGWPALNSEAARKDTDGDGIPDEWESAHGLDPNDASDGATVASDGYTNLEIYMNSLVADIMDGGNAGGKLLSGNLEFSDPAVQLPAYEEPVINDLVIDATTYLESETTTKWNFDGGVSVTNTNSKGYATGSNGRLKYSNGTKFTVNLPDGFTASGVTITGYNNYTTTDAYFKEINGEDGSAYILPKSKEEVTHEVTFSTPVTGSFTFTPDKSQIVISMTVHVTSATSGIADVTESDVETGDNRIFNLMGVEVSRPLAPGIYIQNGKKFLVK